MRTKERQYQQHKIKCLLEVCENFNGAEQYIKERITELCNKSKLSIDEVTYLLTTILRLL